MVGHFNLALLLSAVAGSIAAPVEELVPRNLTVRGPHNFVLTPGQGLGGLARRSNPNYNQDYTTGGSVNYYNSGTGFEVQWDTSNDFVVGIGWNPGNTIPINLGGQFEVGGGTGLLSIYGWSTNPLVEYYIIEDYANPPSFGQQKGSVYSDGSNYVIWENSRYNEPSIQGTSTFNQYISVRQSPHTDATVTVENHFQAWRNLGMNLGNLNFQVVAVEGWGGSGQGSFAVNNS